MTQGTGIGSGDYRTIGLLANPFAKPERASGSGIGTALATEAAALRALSAVDEAASEGRPRPVRVAKAAHIPTSYHMSAMARFISLVGDVEAPKLLPVFVPLFMMRMGRIRGTLSAVSEIVSGRELDLTIAAYARAALVEPDTSLPEWEAASSEDIEAAVARLQEEPAAWVAEFFGTPDDIREEDRLAKIDQIMKDASRRTDGLDPEPVEDDATLEAAEGEFEPAGAEPVAGDATALEPEPNGAQPEGEGEAAEAVQEEVEAAPDPLEHPLVAYLIAHAQKHLSSVIARGLRAYVTDGTSATAQEFKITRAPRKTLAALGRFACFGYYKLVVIFDQFEGWLTIPEDMRAEILGGLSEIRFSLGSSAVIVVAASDEGMPEIDEQYAGAIQVPWDFAELARVQDAGAAKDVPALHAWLDSAAVAGADVKALHARIEEATAGSEDMPSAVEAARDAIEEVARG